MKYNFLDEFLLIVFLITSVVSIELCLDTIIFEFKSDDVFSNTIFSIDCWSFGNQSRWSLLIEHTILAKLLLSIFVLILFANKIILSKVIIFSFEKWVKKEILVKDFNIFYKKKETRQFCITFTS